MAALTRRKKRLRLQLRQEAVARPLAAAETAVEPAAETAGRPVAAFHTRRAKLAYWGLFAFAVVAFSQVDGIFGVTRVFHEGKHAAIGSSGALLAGIAWVVLLAATVFSLGLFIYESERGRGKVKHPVRVYERLLARWEGPER